MEKAYSISNPNFGTPAYYATAATAKAHARRWSAVWPRCAWTVTHLKAKLGAVAAWNFRRGRLTARFIKARAGYIRYKG